MCDKIEYVSRAENALKDADIAFIFTEWDEIKSIPISEYERTMKTPIIYDGRNCYNLDEVEKYNVEYHSIGRRAIKNI